MNARVDLRKHANLHRAETGNETMYLEKGSRVRNKDQLDTLIAAHAVALGVTVVTNTIEDFARYPDAMTENWLTSAEPEK